MMWNNWVKENQQQAKQQNDGKQTPARREKRREEQKTTPHTMRWSGRKVDKWQTVNGPVIEMSSLLYDSVWKNNVSRIVKKAFFQF